MLNRSKAQTSLGPTPKRGPAPHTTRTAPRSGDPSYAGMEEKLSAAPPITVPTVVIQGADDGLEPDGVGPSPADGYFTGGFDRQVVENVGHFPHREKPEAVVRAMLGAAFG